MHPPIPLFFFFIISLTTSTPPPPKFPHLQTFASIGDSYSSGLGSGPRLDFPCSRYASSHPHLLHTSLLGPNPNRTHHFLSCSGHTSTQVLQTQIPNLPSDIHLLTISAGGNDVGLGSVLSACIYQFYLAGEEECRESVREAVGRISEGVVERGVKKVVEAARGRMHPEGVIYVTGYAEFFAAEDTGCDDVTWAVWKGVPGERQYLSLRLRHALNGLVREVNQVLDRVVREAGERVRFVDYSGRVSELRGRYCEEGVKEPAPNHPGLLFYEWDTVDEEEDGEEVRFVTGEDVPRGSWEAGIAERVERMVREGRGGEWEAGMGLLNRTKMEELGREGVIGDTVHWLLPDSWKRVFHLRPGGHAIVAGMVVEDLERREREREREENMEL